MKIIVLPELVSLTQMDAPSMFYATDGISRDITPQVVLN